MSEPAKQGLTVVPFDPTIPEEAMDPFPGLKPGREKKFAVFHLAEDKECPKFLTDIQSTPEKYRFLGVLRTDFNNGGYTMLVSYVEGGLISDEEAESARKRAEESINKQRERLAKAMGSKPEDLFGPGLIESSLGQEERKPVEADASFAGAIDFEDPIPQMPPAFSHMENTEPESEPDPAAKTDDVKKDA